MADIRLRAAESICSLMARRRSEPTKIYSIIANNICAGQYNMASRIDGIIIIEYD